MKIIFHLIVPDGPPACMRDDPSLPNHSFMDGHFGTRKPEEVTCEKCLASSHMKKEEEPQ